MLFHAPVERAAAEAELGGGKRDIEVVHPQGPLDHLLFGLVEVEARPASATAAAPGRRRQREILEPVGVALGQDDRTLGGMAQRADIARPVVSHQRFQHVRRAAAAPGRSYLRA